MTKDVIAINPNSGHKESSRESPPVGFIPTPTIEYRAHRKTLKTTVEPGRPVLEPAAAPMQAPAPLLTDPRVLMWKQDPSVSEIGIRRAFIPSYVASGPSDARIKMAGVSVVNKNSMGDFIEVPDTEPFDNVHSRP